MTDPSTSLTIERVADAGADVVAALATLLLDAVDDNAGISFMAGLRREAAEDWWRSLLASIPRRAVVLVARLGREIVGTIQLQPAWAPNQPHRGDIAKLIVHRKARGHGVARALVRRIEQHARDEGFSLLVLDTCKGAPAERLYASEGWVRAGEIPAYALNPDGSPCDSVFFYKRL